MDIARLRAEFRAREAIIIHCTRAGRDGEMVNLPLYPDDLRQTIKHLEAGDVRDVSCSVVWPLHQHCWGSVGIIVEPRSLGGIVSVDVKDSGHGSFGGEGAPISARGVAQTFEGGESYNEWVLREGDVRGLFVDLRRPHLIVAREELLELPDDTPDHLMPLNATKVRMDDKIEPDELRADFPDLDIFGFVGGKVHNLTRDRVEHPFRG